MTRYPHYKPVKIYRGCAAEELARFVGVHKKTVREWIKKGFPMDGVKRPAPDVNKWIVERIEESRINDHE